MHWRNIEYNTGTLHTGHTGHPGNKDISYNILHRHSEIDIPINDIFTQDFFFACYSKLSSESNSFTNSKEGFTYMNKSVADRAAKFLLEKNFLTVGTVEHDKYRDKI